MILSVKKISLAGALCLAVSCISTSGSFRHRIVLHQDAFVSTRSGKPAAVRAEVPLEIDSEEFPLYVQKPGYQSAVLVSTRNRGEQIEVDLPPIDLWNSASGQHHADRTLYEVLSETSKIQAFFADNQPGAALEKIETLERKYPFLETLKFLKASALVLLGEKERARTILEEALRAWPDNEDGQTLYQRLTGAPYGSGGGNLPSRKAKGTPP